MRYLIDTNICIYIMNNHPPEIIQKCREIGVGNIGISSITTSELQYGANKSKQVKKNLKRLEEFLNPFAIIPYDEMAFLAYGVIRADLEMKGNIIGPLDMLIAAHALSQNLILVTNNFKEFKRVKALKVENWVDRQ
ncbi:type II toxin-antitoxin system VapC family toxin [uncultured Desulfosarcina sp.]|uniref:type II toxin-antitoxin system tRNA(fMet)-specific endonuclease VapC n=1 Tax=uncultured Desulfosarcina sp. TaxID=218289 RepID=UPI0029C9990F|nr:type II toxin-antitoxin system VapC family toxin [uncultured Desulfosarcina sp.]